VRTYSELDGRILEAVAQVTYAEGINATGVDRLSEAARVSKRTLYQHFGSKDRVVAEALEMLDPRMLELIVGPGEAARRNGATERAQILSVFEALTDRVGRTDFRGCPFSNATAELADPEHPAHAVVAAHKARVRRWFEAAARRGRFRRPGTLAVQLMVLYDGAMLGASFTDGRRVARAACRAAEALLSASAPQSIGDDADEARGGTGGDR
jgi:AcrR family transcriptional regulator